MSRRISWGNFYLGTGKPIGVEPFLFIGTLYFGWRKCISFQEKSEGLTTENEELKKLRGEYTEKISGLECKLDEIKKENDALLNHTPNIVRDLYFYVTELTDKQRELIAAREKKPDCSWDDIINSEVERVRGQKVYLFTQEHFRKNTVRSYQLASSEVDAYEQQHNTHLGYIFQIIQLLEQDAAGLQNKASFVELLRKSMLRSS